MVVPRFQRRRATASVGTTRCSPVAADSTVAVPHVLLAGESITMLDVGFYELCNNITLKHFQATGCNVEELEPSAHDRLASRAPRTVAAIAIADGGRQAVQMVAQPG